jgi:hypothetical protein
MGIKVPKIRKDKLIPITQAHGIDREVVASLWSVSMTLVTSTPHVLSLVVALTRMSSSIRRLPGCIVASCNNLSSEICRIPSMLGNMMRVLGKVI